MALTLASPLVEIDRKLATRRAGFRSKGDEAWVVLQRSFAIETVACAAMCFGLAGVFLRFATASWPVFNSLSDHAYGIYLVHYVFVIWLQYLLLGGKARAMLAGRFFVTTDDIRSVAHPVLRHRVITNFNAESSGISPDKVIDRLIEEVPERRENDEIAPELKRAFA